MLDIKISLRQIKKMQHCIGWDNLVFINGRVALYRNFYTCPFEEKWAKELFKLGLVGKYIDETDGYITYYVTRKGLDFLELLFNVKIDEENE